MPPHEELSGELYIGTEDGSAYKLLEHILSQPISFEYASAQQVTNAVDCSGTVSFTIRIKKGVIDITCGRPWTSAAQRYIRQRIRKKEKERRRRLKHENSDT